MFPSIMLFLGSGRALEAFLGGAKIILFAYFLWSGGAAQVSALYNLLWVAPEVVVIAPLAVIGLIQLWGLTMNFRGAEWSWVPRALAGAGGMAMWTWVALKSVLIGALGIEIPIALWLALWNGFIFWKAWNRLPIPGVKQVS